MKRRSTVLGKNIFFKRFSFLCLIRYWKSFLTIFGANVNLFSTVYIILIDDNFLMIWKKRTLKNLVNGYLESASLSLPVEILQATTRFRHSDPTLLWFDNRFLNFDFLTFFVKCFRTLTEKFYSDFRVWNYIFCLSDSLKFSILKVNQCLIIEIQPL